MSIYHSPGMGFTSLSWEPPEGWVEMNLKKRQGRHRFHLVSGLDEGDQTFFQVQVEGIAREIGLTVQVMLSRAGSVIYHAGGLISTRFGSGYHPYWALLHFSNRPSQIAVPSETRDFLFS